MSYDFHPSSRYESARSSDWRDRRPNDYTRTENPIHTINQRNSRIEESTRQQVRGNTIVAASWRHAQSIQTLPAVSRDRETRSRGHLELAERERRRSEWAARTHRYNEARDAFRSRTNFNYPSSVPHSNYNYEATMPEIPPQDVFHHWYLTEPHLVRKSV